MGSRNPRAPRPSLLSACASSRPSSTAPNPTPTISVSKDLCIKKEAPDDEIKEYAETAMNEFLGWYGYDKVDSRDTQGLNLHHFSRRPSAADEDSSDESCSPPRKRSNSNCASPPSEGSSTGTTSCVSCCWCSKTATQKSFSLKTPNGLKSFCSELCFTQCRRANFKRNKTCDWCRHIRHTVNYVDFQDGENQLQFCSDKCLNQYKMNIFCKETEAHLQLHPHLAEGAAGSAAPGGLITPELWLRDCRSASPPSTSPSPPPPEPPREPKPSSHEKKKPQRPKRNKSPLKGPSHHYPPPLLPLNGSIGPFPNFPPPRPPFLGGYFSPMLPGTGRLPGGLKHHLISPPTPPPVMLPPPRPPAPPAPPPKSFLPPVTILVPYPFPIPIPIPLPMPIPIPIDMSKYPFMKAFQEAKVKDVAPEEVKSKSEVETVKPDTVSAPPVTASPRQSSSHSVPRPLRKRRRVTDKDGEPVGKRKTVPA